MESKCTIIRAHFLPTWTGLRSALRDKTDLQVRTTRIACPARRDAAPPPSDRSTDRAHRRAIAGIAAVADERRVGRDEPLLHALLLLHPPVLEPDLDLRLVELQRRGDLYPPRPRQVLVEVELLLQLCQLLRREVGSACVVDAAGTGLTCVPVLVGLRNCCKK